jgi:hypothetical protein
MKQFIDQMTPLMLALILGLIGVVTVLISKSQNLVGEQDVFKRREIARHALLDALSPNLCLASFSYDIWVITTLFAADPTALQFYNLTGKQNAIQTLLVIHIVLFLFVAGWGPLVRGNTTTGIGLELSFGWLAVILCILFQVYL